MTASEEYRAMHDAAIAEYEKASQLPYSAAALRRAVDAALARRPQVEAEPAREAVADAWVVQLNYGNGRWSGDMLTDVLPSDKDGYRIIRPLYALPAKTEGDGWTYGHCKDKKLPGGCPHHNLQCGYPDCDRRRAPSPEEG